VKFSLFWERSRNSVPTKHAISRVDCINLEILDYLQTFDREMCLNLAKLSNLFNKLIKIPAEAKVAEGIRRPDHLLADFEVIP
jgi:hypothetical protein